MAENVTWPMCKEYSIPTVPRGQYNVCSRRETAYVVAAPDFSRSAGSVGKFMGVGISRTLELTAAWLIVMERERIQRTILNMGSTPWSPLGQALRPQYHCRTHLHIGEAALSAL